MNRSTTYYRLLVALVAAVLVGVFVSRFLSSGRLANDFQWPYSAALQLRAGHNPYVGLLPDVPRDFYTGTDPLFYPLPAVMLALPFSYLDPVVAGTVFSSLSAFLLAYALTVRAEWWRLVALASAPALVAFGNVQWSPLLLASVYLWWLSPICMCKPSLGVAAWVARPRWYAVVVASLVLLGSLVLLPSWPLDWLYNLRETHHAVPLLAFYPGLLAVSLLALRHRNGRFYLAWSLVPQMVFFYDALLLFSIPENKWQMAVLWLGSWVAMLSFDLPYGREKWLEYHYIALPALCMVLWQARHVLFGRSVVGRLITVGNVSINR